MLGNLGSCLVTSWYGGGAVEAAESILVSLGSAPAPGGLTALSCAPLLALSGDSADLKHATRRLQVQRALATKSDPIPFFSEGVLAYL